jgi:hypothetical protein
VSVESHFFRNDKEKKFKANFKVIYWIKIIVIISLTFSYFLCKVYNTQVQMFH